MKIAIPKFILQRPTRPVVIYNMTVLLFYVSVLLIIAVVAWGE
jgi:hypothetical protein